MYSSCLAASKFIWRKINFDVWFVQIFLQKMLYIAKPPNFPYTSLAVNKLIMNQFDAHSQKKQNPAKKENQIRSNWDRAAEEKVRSEARSKARSSEGKIKAARSSGMVLRSTINAIRSSDWSSVCGRRRSLFFLYLCDLGSLSLPLSRSLSLLVPCGISFSGSLSLLRVEGNGLKVK